MRTKLILCAMLAASLMLCACNEKQVAEPAKPAIAVVDVSRALRDSDAGKAGMQFLEKAQQEAVAEINALQEKIKADEKNEALQQQLQASYMALQQRMQAEQQNVISRLNDMFTRVVEDVRAKKGLVVVMPTEGAALAYDKSADVTDEVIAAMNKEKVEYTPVAPAKPLPNPAETKPADDAKAADDAKPADDKAAKDEKK